MNPSVNITGQIKVILLLYIKIQHSYSYAQTLGDGTLNTDCNGLINDNSGCGINEWSRASYGPTFDAQGGGVYAMKWDENGIAVCKICEIQVSVLELTDYIERRVFLPQCSTTRYYSWCPCSFWMGPPRCLAFSKRLWPPQHLLREPFYRIRHYVLW